MTNDPEWWTEDGPTRTRALAHHDQCWANDVEGMNHIVKGIRRQLRRGEDFAVIRSQLYAAAQKNSSDEDNDDEWLISGLLMRLAESIEPPTDREIRGPDHA